MDKPSGQWWSGEINIGIKKNMISLTPIRKDVNVIPKNIVELLLQVYHSRYMKEFWQTTRRDTRAGFRKNRNVHNYIYHKADHKKNQATNQKLYILFTNINKAFDNKVPQGRSMYTIVNIKPIYSQKVKFSLIKEEETVLKT